MQADHHDAPRSPEPGWLGDVPWAYTTRCFSALDHRFAFRVADPALGRHLDGLYAPMVVAAQPRTWYSLLDRGVDRSTDRWAAYVDDQLALYTSDAGATFNYILWHINHAAVAASSRYVLLHAAAAAQDGRAIVLCAPPEAGKTTLVAGLVRAGLSYVTDEVVALDPTTGLLHPYPKPLSIDKGSWSVLPDLAPHVDGTAARYFSHQWQVQAASLHPSALAGLSRPCLVVLPHYDPARPTSLESVSRAAALAALMENSFKFAHPTLAGSWLAPLGAMLAECDSYRLSTGPLDVACRRLLGMLE